MWKLWFILLLSALIACNKDYNPDYGIDMDKINAISIDESQNYGVAILPSDAGSEITQHFDKYTRVVAENGKFIHLFAPISISSFELARQREILKGILKDYPNSNHGADKSQIGNYLAEKNTCILYFSDSATLKSVSEGILLAAPIRISSVLYENMHTEGSSQFVSGLDVDYSLSKLLKVVLKEGIANTNFGYNSEIYNAANNARSNSVWIPSNLNQLLDDGDLGASYIATLTEVYYGQWQKSGIVAGGIYLYPDRDNLTSDPLGVGAIESFFHPHIPYTIILDPAFSDDLELEFNSNVFYTYRSQYFGDVDMRYCSSNNISANAYRNVILGNGLDNAIEGKSGDDSIDGNDGFDVAIFSGNRNDYLISNSSGYTIVQDTVPSRDGLDSLIRIERLQFQDMFIDL